MAQNTGQTVSSANAATASFATSQISTATPGQPTKRALLVGISQYKYPAIVPSLNGTINDVEAMKSVLIGKFDFPPENVLVLKNEQATHAGILKAIEDHLIAKTQPGDIVVFDYSGHGSQMIDTTGKKPNGLDESIVPFDSRDPQGKVFDIGGSELHQFLVKLAAKTKNLTFILDSCHSGTLVKDPAAVATVRAIPKDDRKPPTLPAAPVTRNMKTGAGAPDEKLSYAVMAAATGAESAYEYHDGTAWHGAMTYYLARKLQTARAGTTYRDIMDSVMASVTANNAGQHPQLEGVEADQFVFGDSQSLAGAYFLASPADKGAIVLNAGDVQGITAGSKFDVYRPGTKKFGPPQQPIAKIEVTKVQPFQAEAKLLSGGSIPASSRAVERQHAYGTLRMRLYFDRLEQSSTLQAIKTALKDLPQVEPVTNGASCNMQLRETGGRILTLLPDATTLSTPIPVGREDTVGRVVKQVSDWATWFNALSVHNEPADFALEFTVQKRVSRGVMTPIARPDLGIHDGEQVTFTLKNTSSTPLYVGLLDFSTDGSIVQMYPAREGTSEILESGKSISDSLTAKLPSGHSIITDVLKVFGADQPIDFRYILRGRIKDTGAPPADPLTQVLQLAGTGTKSALMKTTELSEWVTTQRVVTVRK
ncbi:MAG TPA: caspase family protein [Candidatus Solibacter sp.]|nr:caspase family protein [Candidatus Solibacter sp.]